MEAGLYDKDNKLIYTWNKLINEKLIQGTDKVLENIRIFSRHKSYDLIIDKNIECIGNFCFAFNEIEKINIPKNINNIEDMAFFDNRLKCISVEKENPFYSEENNILYNKNKSILIQYPALKKQNEGKYKIKSTVTNIKNHAFMHTKYINEIIIPKNVKSIETGAFFYSQIKNIKMEGVEEIGKSAFSEMDIDKIILPSTLKRIDEKIFLHTSIKEIIYLGTQEQFKKIEGWEHVFYKSDLTLEQIEFHKTLEDLIAEGKSIREANTIIKNQKEERAI